VTHGDMGKAMTSQVQSRAGRGLDISDRAVVFLSESLAQFPDQSQFKGTPRGDNYLPVGRLRHGWRIQGQGDGAGQKERHQKKAKSRLSHTLFVVLQFHFKVSFLYDVSFTSMIMMVN
jgi:hypothetical protein